jgi:hypothetical protein
MASEPLQSPGFSGVASKVLQAKDSLEELGVYDNHSEDAVGIVANHYLWHGLVVERK